MPPPLRSTVLNVALTGNVASGKSTVVSMFASWGATIIDSDALVAEAQQAGTGTLAAIELEFGRSVILPDGSLHRAALRRLILADDAKRARLNAIVHPIVQARREALLSAARERGDRIVVSDIPLLFEVLDPSAFDLVVLVESPKRLRRKRLLDRGLSLSEAEQLMEAQIPSEKKRTLADIVIDNGGSLEELEEATREAWDYITSRANA